MIQENIIIANIIIEAPKTSSGDIFSPIKNHGQILPNTLSSKTNKQTSDVGTYGVPKVTNIIPIPMVKLPINIRLENRKTILKDLNSEKRTCH